MSMANNRPHIDEAFADAPGSDNFGHLLWETSVRWMALSEPLLAGTQLTFASGGALSKIAACPGITASELARGAFKTQQAISQVTGRLERLGYIERRVGQGRGVGLHITAVGERALAEGMAIEEAMEQEARRLLGEQLYGELKERLRLARAAIADVG